MNPRAAAVAATALLCSLAACKGGSEIANNSADDLVITSGKGAAGSGAEVVTVDAGGAALDAGATPMNEREAVLGFLNKRNGIVHDLRMKPGMAVRVNDAIIHLRACETTAPWEEEKLTGAFLQLDVRGADNKYRRVFSGWVYKESPSLNVVQHPVYDVWPKSCAMNFPAGPEAPAPSSNSSRAQNSPGPAAASAPSPAPAEPAAETPSPSAVANNAE